MPSLFPFLPAGIVSENVLANVSTLYSLLLNIVSMPSHPDFHYPQHIGAHMFNYVVPSNSSSLLHTSTIPPFRAWRHTHTQSRPMALWWVQIAYAALLRCATLSPLSHWFSTLPYPSPFPCLFLWAHEILQGPQLTQNIAWATYLHINRLLPCWGRAHQLRHIHTHTTYLNQAKMNFKKAFSVLHWDKNLEVCHNALHKYT